jgi:hypothetical protein
MKRILSILSVASLFALGSCQKVIDIDLNSADPKLVIECLLTDTSGPCKVSLTRTVDYFDGGNSPGVSGATVVLSDNAGNTEQLSEATPGNYFATTIQGVPGRTYTLSVTVDGTTYTSQSTMQQPVPIDTIFAEYYPPLFGADGGYVTTAPVQDPAGVANFYRQRIFINGVLQDTAGTYFIADDQFSDGRYVQFPLFPVIAQLGDTVTVQMWLLEEKAYRYIEALSLISGGTDPSQAAPANPDYQFTNDALGYFMAAPVVERTFVVQ